MPLLVEQPYKRACEISVPHELQSLLYEFTVAYLMEQPTDLVEFAVEYFSKLRDRRELCEWGEEEDLENLELRDDTALARAQGQRRRSILAEEFDPETEETTPTPVYPKSSAHQLALRAVLSHVFLFKNLDEIQLQALTDAMFEKKVGPGEFVIKEGDHGDFFYVIKEGSFQATTGQKVLKVYKGEGSFGELALMYQTPRAASVQAITPGSLWALDRTTFRKIVVQQAFMQRKKYERFIDRVPMLQTLDSYEKMNLADALVPMAFKDGDKIIEQGTAGTGMYFIEGGAARVLVRGPGGVEREVKELPAGSYFGELALLTNKPRAASVVAVGETKVAFLDVEAFERLLGPCMEIMKRNTVTYDLQIHDLFDDPSALSH